MSGVPAPQRKRPDYTHRPAGAVVWAGLVAYLVFELVAVFRNEEYTLSRTVWWLLGPPYEPRWWLLLLPLDALLLWCCVHFAWPHLFGPRELLIGLGVAVAVALAAIAVRAF